MPTLRPQTGRDPAVSAYMRRQPLTMRFLRRLSSFLRFLLPHYVDEGKASGIKRIDARSDDALVKQAKDAGVDLDEGMVVLHDGKMYHGAEALNIMARLAPDSGFGNRLNRLLFSNSTVSRVAYPALRAGRNMLLKLLGRKKIAEIDRAKRLGN